MTQLVSAYNERFNRNEFLFENRENSQPTYRWISQQAFLDKLKNVGIDITSQTLRNWDKLNLITHPRKPDRQKSKELRVEYCEFALAEAFAVFQLTKAQVYVDVADTNVFLPKFSLLHMEIARLIFCKSYGFVHGFIKPPEDTYRVYYEDAEALHLLNDLPPVSFNFKGCIDQAALPTADNFEDLTKQLFFQTLYSAWFLALKQGCEIFLRDKRFVF